MQGRERDRTSTIWVPPSRTFVRVEGNLNRGALAKDVFLWFRPIKTRSASTYASPFQKGAMLPDDKKRAEVRSLSRNGYIIQVVGQVESNVKRVIRQFIPQRKRNGNPDGPLDVAPLFNMYDSYGKGHLNIKQFRQMLKEVSR